MTPTLFVTKGSPPCEAVEILAKAIEVTLIYKEVDLEENEHLDPLFLELNPQHTVPTLLDKGLVLWDSHTIMAYLLGKYAKNTDLYPSEFSKRAIIDQRLHFDSEVLHVAYKNAKKSALNQALSTEVLDAFDFLEKFLTNQTWIAGDNLSIADFSIYSTTKSLYKIYSCTLDDLKNLKSWMDRFEKSVVYGKPAGNKRRDFVDNIIVCDNKETCCL